MFDDDQILLESFEHIFQVLKQETARLKEVKSIHAERVRFLEKEIRSHARILEDISLPARFILEHILELKYKAGQMAVEAENITQGFSPINDVWVEEFGVIKIATGSLILNWRDQLYNYLLYPDKVEFRTIDEKATIKLFFSHVFTRQEISKFASLQNSPNVLYIHPSLQKIINKVSNKSKEIK
ncbi:MAG TPA: hypothetical protein GXX46_03685 [Peptococcaceae bacterium]|nr:hypothetical protein [Peptococcaceae bacterium]